MADTALHGTDQEKADWKAICDFVGAEEGAVWTREQEEKFALAGERYLAEGQAPSAELVGVFDRLKKWFLDLYHKVSNTGVEISPQMRNVFDRMISSDLPRNEMADWLRAGLAPANRRDLMRAMEKALFDFENGDAVDVGQILRESRTLGEAYDVVRRDPLGGNKDDLLSILEPEDIERILVHRGPAVWNSKEGKIDVTGREVKKAKGSKRGYGLVKIIFRHGEGGNVHAEDGIPAVTKEDVVSMPKLIREWEPSERNIRERPDGIMHGATRWDIPRKDGLHLVIVSGMGADGSDSRLVSMYVSRPDREPSKKRIGLESPHPSARQDKGYTTDGVDVLSNSVGPNRLNENISQSSDSVNVGVSSIDEQIARARQEAHADIPRSDFDQRAAQAEQEARLSFETEREVEYPQAPPIVEDAASVAQNYQERMRQTLEAMNGGRPLDRIDPRNKADVDAETALHEEIAEGIERARQAGILTEEQQRELLLNREQTEKAKTFDELGQTAVECVWNAAEHV